MLRDATRCMFPKKGEIRKSYHYRKVYDFTVRKVIYCTTLSFKENKRRRSTYCVKLNNDRESPLECKGFIKDTTVSYRHRQYIVIPIISSCRAYVYPGCRIICNTCIKDIAAGIRHRFYRYEYSL